MNNAAQTAIDEILNDTRLLVMLGPGGVGKTTLAAAIGLREAKRGRRVLVLTIDPAKRLADALGLEGIDDSISAVDFERTSNAKGALYAAMLDTAHSYDALIARIAKPEAAERILSNAVYQAFSRTLARSHAYVAAERLFEVMADDRFDLVVLDTPPTRNALEILDAPKTLAQFLERDVLKYFVAPDEARLRRPLLSIARLGGRAVLSLLGKIAGEQIVDELLLFFGVLLEQQEGFRTRAETNSATLAAQDTTYVLVTSVEEAALNNATFLREALTERGFHADLTLFNRALNGELGARRGSLSPLNASPSLRSRLKAYRRMLEARQEHAYKKADEFVQSSTVPTLGVLLPKQSEEIQDLDGLERLLSALYTVEGD